MAYGRQRSILESVVRDKYADRLKTRRFDPTPYRFDSIRYLRECLRWEPWEGVEGHPGQVEILRDYDHVLRQLQERRDYGQGKLTAEQLKHWQPGEIIQNWFRVESANAVGKTRTGSGIVNHFFDTHRPSIVYAIAPSYRQVHDLLFKEIKSTREGKGLPGRILDLRLERGEDHFVVGVATTDAGGTGIEKIQGQHSPHILFLVDEAEGVESFVYRAIDTMAKGYAVVVMFANPRTRASEFYKRRLKAEVRNYRIDAIHHVNVREDREAIPGAVTRADVEAALRDHCTVADSHDPDNFTFEVPWRPGTVYLPDEYFCTSFLGIAPNVTHERTFVPLGRYEEACKREPLDDEPDWARIGVDVAREGSDKGAIYVRHAGAVRLWARLSKADTNAYAGELKTCCEDLRAKGCKNVQIRIDYGGGFGGGVGDRIIEDEDFRAIFEPPDDAPDKKAWGLTVVPVQFGSRAMDSKRYADKSTEIYAEAAEALKGLRLEKPPPELQGDLTERRWEWINTKGREVKKIEPKDRFKGRMGRSPDDGDALALAVTPDHCFNHEWVWA